MCAYTRDMPTRNERLMMRQYRTGVSEATLGLVVHGSRQRPLQHRRDILLGGGGRVGVPTMVVCTSGLVMVKRSMNSVRTCPPQ